MKVFYKSILRKYFMKVVKIDILDILGEFLFI